MEYENPTPENVMNSMNIILKKEYDTKTRIKFFLGFLRVIGEEPERLKLILLDQIDKLINDL